MADPSRFWGGTVYRKEKSTSGLLDGVLVSKPSIMAVNRGGYLQALVLQPIAMGVNTHHPGCIRTPAVSISGPDGYDIPILQMMKQNLRKSS